MGGFFPLVELHQEGSAPAACAAGLFVCVTPYGLRLGGAMTMARLWASATVKKYIFRRKQLSTEKKKM